MDKYKDAKEEYHDISRATPRASPRLSLFSPSCSERRWHIDEWTSRCAACCRLQGQLRCQPVHRIMSDQRRAGLKSACVFILIPSDMSLPRGILSDDLFCRFLFSMKFGRGWHSSFNIFI